MADVFISYRNTEDRRAIVSRLATILRSHGLTVWWDYGLAAGVGFKEQIERELIAAKVVIPVWCSESVKSDWVKREATLAEDKLLPVRLQKVSPPTGFEHLHAHHLESWTGSILDPQLDEFVKAVCARAGHVEEISADTKSELAKLPRLKTLSRVGQKRLLAACVGLGAILLLAGGAYWSLRHSELLQPPVIEIADETLVATETPISEIVRPVFEPRQWHLGPVATGGTGILDYRKRTGASGKGVTIAQIDTGIYFQHNEFIRHPSFLPGYDFISDPEMSGDGDGIDADPNETGGECTTSDISKGSLLHGSFHASVLFARGEGRSRMTGVAPDAKLVPVRVVGHCGGKLSEVNLGIRWAAGLDVGLGVPLNPYPADIILVPLSIPAECPESTQRAVDAARAEGAVIISGVGNSRTSKSLSAPANCRGVISVGATSMQGNPASYTNTGADLMAPGGDLKQDLNADGFPDGIIGAKYAANCMNDDGSTVENCDYSMEQGTSASAAVFAGALALIKSAHPDKPLREAVDMLLNAAAPMDARQCSLPCDDRPDLEPIPGLAGICFASCGAGRLDMSLIP
ncbi:S8 family serine peptidase [Hyphomonas sp.]|uniref:S8 family serine peptidase n=1 Tax=Hyphomonas sp. TaxID=87 RepID=UPI00391A0FF1